MRAYRNLLAHISETAPRKLADLPRAFVVEQARGLLGRGEIYLLEQVDKRVSVMAALPAGDVARAAREALSAGAVDDFCFLYGHLPGAMRPGAGSIDAACRRLARRGNAAGIEQVITATGVRPRIDEETARRGYDVLAAAGRPGAVDYLRQLSGVPVRFAPSAVAAGVRVLLATGRYGALGELVRAAGPAAHVPAVALREGMENAVADGQLRELAGALATVGSPCQVEGFARYLQRLLAEERITEIPALYTLCADADWGALDDATWLRLITSADAPAVRFVFGRCADAALLRGHSRAGYGLGVRTGDRDLVRLACQRGGAVLHGADARALLDDALEERDLAWVDFAAAELGALPAADPDRAQCFLARLADQEPERAASYAAVLGVDPDAAAGAWLLQLADGRFGEAACSAARVTGHEVAAAMASVLGDGCRGHDATP